MRTRFLPLAFALAAAAPSVLAQAPAEAPADLNGTVLTEDPGGLPGSPQFDALEILSLATDAGGDMLGITSGLAVEILDDYAVTLAQYPNSEALVADLRLVRTQVASGNPDATTVGEALLRMGRATQATAGEDSNYHTLGGALLRAGEQLLGRDDD